eukprot:2927816-Rhodomonas_salina.1
MMCGGDVRMMKCGGDVRMMRVRSRHCRPLSRHRHGPREHHVEMMDDDVRMMEDDDDVRMQMMMWGCR